MSCVCCGGPEQIGHHVSYDPERRVPVCRSCHSSIHSHWSEHSLLPEYIPISKTRSKQPVRSSIDGYTMARLERMVLEEGLSDINHALEVLCKEHSTVDEADAATYQYHWNNDKQRVETTAERSEKMSKVWGEDA